MLAKRTWKNQLTLPKEVIKHFDDIDYFDVSVQNRKIVLTPVKIMPAEESESGLEGIREKMQKLGIVEDDVAEAVAWARRKRR